MFRASSCSSSGAYQLQQQLLVYRRNVVVALLLVVVGPYVICNPCVFVALGIQHAMPINHTVICGLSRSTVFFHIS